MNKIHTHSYRLAADHTNAQRELPPALLVRQVIECATEHADILGCGFERLQTDGLAWVLSRLAFQMNRYPGIFEDYTISTWIENYNRHFSQRNFEFRTAAGEILGYARTIWVAIDLKTRRPGNIEDFGRLADANDHSRPCPIDPPAKLRPVANPDSIRTYTFRVSDIDFNRHVTSARYVELAINTLSLSDFDANILHRFDIDYKLESHFDNLATIGAATSGPVTDVTISVADRPVCLARLQLSPR